MVLVSGFPDDPDFEEGFLVLRVELQGFVGCRGLEAIDLEQFEA